MKKSILLLLISLNLIACAKSGSGSGDQSIQDLKCEGYINKQWVNLDTKNNYTFNPNCSGEVIECEASFTYDTVSDSSIYINVSKSNNKLGCPQVGSSGYCDYHIKATAGIVQSMTMTCEGNEVIFVLKE